MGEFKEPANTNVNTYNNVAVNPVLQRSPTRNAYDNIVVDLVLQGSYTSSWNNNMNLL